ncbi:MAG: hypothetical protein A2V83_05435 [Nitrospirae bacterium RBG_16_64_22]|nr:MAG: hypothetical protein A2V83_05435 [Nitrospirae bacterium RBG_16_64_22]
MAVVVLLIGVALISTSAILVTLAGSPPTVSAFYRNAFAAGMWLPIILVGLARGNGTAHLRHSGRTWLRLFLLGFFFAVDLWAWHRSIFLIGAGPATLIGNSQIFFIGALSFWFFKERAGRFFWPGAVLAMAGIALLTLTRGFGGDVLVGLFMGMVTALTYSAFLLVLKSLLDAEIDLPSVLFWTALIAALLLLLPAAWERNNPLDEPPAALGWLVLHAFLSSVLGWWLIARGMERLPVWTASTLLLMQPVMTFAEGWAVLGQAVTPLQVCGVVLALAGIRLANAGEARFTRPGAAGAGGTWGT